MLSIFINLVFVSGFCFLLIIVLEYTIYLWENHKMNELVKDTIFHQPANQPSEQNTSNPSKFNSENFTNFNSNMKFNINNKYFERFLIIVKSQDYKGWLDNSAKIIKKIISNLSYYSQKIFKHIVDLSKTGNNFPDREIKHTKTDQTKYQINKTIAKISKISEKETEPKIETRDYQTENQVHITELGVKPLYAQTNDFTEITAIKNPSTDSDDQGATLNLAVKDTAIYDKIEKSILAKLQETGLNHYDIWLEFGHFYQKYNEKDKAKEIFAMVMKHSEGKDKELARDGLIALS